MIPKDLNVDNHTLDEAQGDVLPPPHSAYASCSDSSCHGIQYIPYMTQNLQLSKEVVDLDTKLKHLLARLDQLKQEKQNQLKLLQQEKGTLLKELQALRIRINVKLDEMESMIVNEVATKIGLRVQEVSKEIDVISNEKVILKRREMSIGNAKNSDTTELFIQLKIGQANIQKSERSLGFMRTDSHTMNMKILPDDCVHRLLESKSRALGKTSLILIPKCIKQDSEVNVRLPSDKNTCRISDMYITSDGGVYLADCENRRIKKLGQSYAVTEYLDVPGQPVALCELDSTLLAVTLLDRMKVQFVSRNPLTLKYSFTVGDLCRGIDYHDGQLYVCCGGLREKREGPGRIEVYSVGGDLLRSYYQGSSLPNFVHVSERGVLIISNADRSSLIMADHIVYDMQINALHYPGGMCRMGDSQLCVAGYASNNIVLISEDGEHQQELLTEEDGISQPWAVCFNRSQSHLMVSLFRSDTITIFKVNNA